MRRKNFKNTNLFFRAKETDGHLFQRRYPDCQRRDVQVFDGFPPPANPARQNGGAACPIIG